MAEDFKPFTGWKRPPPPLFTAVILDFTSSTDPDIDKLIWELSGFEDMVTVNEVWTVRLVINQPAPADRFQQPREFKFSRWMYENGAVRVLRRGTDMLDPRYLALDFTSDYPVFGDWRDQRNAMEAAEHLHPEFVASNNKSLWDYVQTVLKNYGPLHSVRKCVLCKHEFGHWEMYRCADCNGQYCRNCIKPHFGPNHKPHQ